MKKRFWLGVSEFSAWHHKWVRFLAILADVTWPRAQPLDPSISLNFSLETTLQSESFELLIDILAFLVQTLWSKIYKLINYLIMASIKYFVCFRSGSPNVLSEGRICYYMIVRGPNFSHNAIFSGKVAFHQINKFFLNVLFFHDWQNGFAGRMKWLRGPHFARGP